MTYNTGNPIPSDDPRDLDDNAQVLDRFCNSTASSEPDRFGVQRKTLHAIQALYGLNSTALDGLTGAADRLPYFTGAGAMSLATFTAAARALLDDTTFAAMLTTLGAATRGANADITSITGLTTALGVAYGGTGVTTLAALLTALQGVGAYGRANILGTVGNSSGVPTGAIFETGGTAGGTGVYVKYADSRYTVTKTLVMATGSTTARGTLFASSSISAGNFPFAFVGEAPRVQCSGTDNAGSGWAAMDSAPGLTAWGSYSTRNTSSSGTGGTIYLQAEGRWY